MLEKLLENCERVGLKQSLALVVDTMSSGGYESLVYIILTGHAATRPAMNHLCTSF